MKYSTGQEPKVGDVVLGRIPQVPHRVIGIVLALQTAAISLAMVIRKKEYRAAEGGREEVVSAQAVTAVGPAEDFALEQRETEFPSEDAITPRAAAVVEFIAGAELARDSRPIGDEASESAQLGYHSMLEAIENAELKAQEVPAEVIPPTGGVSPETPKSEDPAPAAPAPTIDARDALKARIISDLPMRAVKSGDTIVGYEGMGMNCTSKEVLADAILNTKSIADIEAALAPGAEFEPSIQPETPPPTPPPGDKTTPPVTTEAAPAVSQAPDAEQPAPERGSTPEGSPATR